MDGVKYETPAHLAVICRKCTRFARIRGKDEDQASRIAAALGWREDSRGMVCPKCPGGNAVDHALLAYLLNSVGTSGTPSETEAPYVAAGEILTGLALLGTA